MELCLRDIVLGRKAIESSSFFFLGIFLRSEYKIVFVLNVKIENVHAL